MPQKNPGISRKCWGGTYKTYESLWLSAQGQLNLSQHAATWPQNGLNVRVSVHGFTANRIYPLSLTACSKCSPSSTTQRRTSSNVLIGQYPDGLRPLVLLAVVIPRTCMASSKCANRSDPCDRSARRSLVSSPCTRCAAPIRALPSADCFPELGPPP